MSRRMFLPRLTRKRVATVALSLLLPILVVLAAAWLVPLPARLGAPSSTVIEYRDGTPAHVFLSPDEKWRPSITLDEVDPAYVEALLRFEDKRFWNHLGVDPLAVGRAAVLNLARGRRVSGASTLTMQLVRMLEPRPRTLGSKVVEALRAVQLELRLSKRELLTAYLRTVPFGRNVEGVQAAALAYFGHTASYLSAAEICTLLAVPQDPNRRFPEPGNRERLRVARDAIARRLLDQGALRPGSLAELQATPVPARMKEFPRHAIHASYWLRQRYPGQVRLRTTLSPDVQRLAERVMDGAKEDAARRGIHNGSLVVVDHASFEVVAAVGSFDFWDAAHGGQISGFARPRSPGSALKPFLYAMALEQGLAGPERLVPDIPVIYGTYAPRNFDNQFSGLVRLEDALSRSLNLPFVNLLRQLGIESFLATLRDMGAESLRPEPGFYGLSAAVGGLEVTPLEVAGFYATLARDGRFRPLRWLARPPSDPGAQEEEPLAQVFSPAAAWVTRQALSLRDRPDFPSRGQWSRVPPRIHWKTGTSFGHRDAWAVGSGPDYTAVVWMGNFDNAPSARLVGADAAGPLLFDVLEGVADRAKLPPPVPPPAELTSVEVCAYSGHKPTEACPERTRTLARKTHVPTEPCPYHVRLDVDVKTGQALTPVCRASREYETRTFVVWPATIRRWLKDQHRRLPEPPAYAPGCQPGGERKPPVILSPALGQLAMLLPGVPPEDQEIPLEAETHAVNAKLSWFLDGEYLGTVRADERLWWKPRVGTHQLRVTDETGRASTRTFEVRDRPR
jgi:penicillin-binding protein 1C